MAAERPRQLLCLDTNFVSQPTEAAFDIDTLLQHADAAALIPKQFNVYHEVVSGALAPSCAHGAFRSSVHTPHLGKGERVSPPRTLRRSGYRTARLGSAGSMCNSVSARRGTKNAGQEHDMNV